MAKEMKTEHKTQEIEKIEMLVQKKEGREKKFAVKFPNVINGIKSISNFGIAASNSMNECDITTCSHHLH